MKKIKIVLLLSTFGLVSLISLYAIKTSAVLKKRAIPVEQLADSLMDGDVIFQTHTGGQGLAIQLATHSPYTHIGIIFKDGTEWKVYEAVEPVQVVPLQTFIRRGDGGKFVIKRLKDRDSLLPQVKLSLMQAYVKKQLRKHYDIHFGWGDDKLYCSELVWKCYDQAGISIGPLKKLKEFDLSNALVKNIMAERYGKNIPYNEKVISPGDIYNNTALSVVSSN